MTRLDPYTKSELIAMLLAFAAIVAVLFFTLSHAGADTPPAHEVVPGKYYVTATVSDGQGHVYDILTYNGAGPFATKAECEKWKAPPTFVIMAKALVTKAKLAYGPDTDVTFGCWTPPKPADKGDI